MEREYSLQDLRQLLLDQKFSEQTARGLEEFYESVHSDQRFSWMGLFETTDQDDKTHWIFYLQPQVALSLSLKNISKI